MTHSLPPDPDALSYIHVCPLSGVESVLERTGARHLVTVINRQSLLETPSIIPAANHLRLAVNDICAPQENMIHPCEEHVAELIDFARRWNRQGQLVIHCWAGISRSTAAAFIMLCTLNPTEPEARIAQRLRAASPTASPNRLMVSLADGLLERRGRMVAAVEEMGQGEPVMEAAPFALPSRFA